MPTVRAILAAPLLTTLLLPAGAAAQESFDGPLDADRPGVTETSGVVPAGRLHLEAGLDIGDRDGGGAESFGAVLLRFGLLPRLELQYNYNSFSARDDAAELRGPEDIQLSLKAAVVRHQRGLLPQVALRLGADISTSGDNSPNPVAALAAGWTLAEVVSVSGYALFTRQHRDEGRVVDLFTTGLSLGLSLSDVTNLYFEPTARVGDPKGTRYNLQGGVTRLLSEDLQLDLHAGVTPGNPDRDVFLGFGIARRW